MSNLYTGDIEVVKKEILKLREYLVKNEFEKWCEFVPKEIHEDFDFLREELLKIEEYKSML